MKSQIPILLVEDDEIDVKNIRRAFRTNRISNPLFTASNGQDALDFLRHEGDYEDEESAPRPGLILLDLNMPVMNGLEFLDAYRRDPNLRAIPAVVLTSSDEERDRLESYEIGIAGYIVKPVRFTSLTEAIRRFDLYWTLCELPAPVWAEVRPDDEEARVDQRT